MATRWIYSMYMRLIPFSFTGRAEYTSQITIVYSPVEYLKISVANIRVWM